MIRGHVLVDFEGDGQFSIPGVLTAMRDLLRAKLVESIATLQAVLADETLAEALEHAAQVTSDAMKAGYKLLIAGNGGSAADAQHLAAEFVCRLTADRPAMAAMALTTDTSILTAMSNDHSYESVFERQVEALGRPGDVFLGISTSGNSENLVRALEMSRRRGLTTIIFTGNGGGAMGGHCDINVIVPSKVTTHIQEAHLALEHVFCMLVERMYFGIALEAYQ